MIWVAENCILSVKWSNRKPIYDKGGPGSAGRIHPNKPTNINNEARIINNISISEKFKHVTKKAAPRLTSKNSHNTNTK